MKCVWLVGVMAVTLVPASGLADPPAGDVSPTAIETTSIDPAGPLELSDAQMDTIRGGNFVKDVIMTIAALADTNKSASSIRDPDDYRNANKPEI